VINSAPVESEIRRIRKGDSGRTGRVISAAEADGKSPQSIASRNQDAARLRIRLIVKGTARDRIGSNSESDSSLRANYFGGQISLKQILTPSMHEACFRIPFNEMVL